MFGLFKKKSEVDKLYDAYNDLLKESHTLSTSNRSASDAKLQEANDILKQIEVLEVKEGK